MNELKNYTFAEIQREYWKRIIQNYVDSISDEERQAQLTKAIFSVDKNGREGFDDIIDPLLDDDATWGEIDNSLEYYLTLLLKEQEPGENPRTFLYTVNMILRDDVLATFEIEAQSEDEAREIVDELFADTDVTDDGKVEIVVHREDYDEDNIVITFTHDTWEENDLENIQRNVENIEFCLQKEKKED